MIYEAEKNSVNEAKPSNFQSEGSLKTPEGSAAPTCDDCSYNFSRHSPSIVKLCSFHAAAPALYEALKKTLTFGRLNGDARAFVLAALALADGQDTNTAASAGTTDQGSLKE